MRPVTPAMRGPHEYRVLHLDRLANHTSEASRVGHQQERSECYFGTTPLNIIRQASTCSRSFLTFISMSTQSAVIVIIPASAGRGLRWVHCIIALDSLRPHVPKLSVLSAQVFLDERSRNSTFCGMTAVETSLTGFAASTARGPCANSTERSCHWQPHTRALTRDVHCKPPGFLVPRQPRTWQTREFLACCARSELAARLRSTHGGWQYTPTAQLARNLVRNSPAHNAHFRSG